MICQLNEPAVRLIIFLSKKTMNSNINLSNLAVQANALRLWLENRSLPFWCSTGIAPDDGGFYERIGQDGKPILADNRRSRVHPRQVYCFSAAGHHGWNGPWQHAATRGLAWFETVYRLQNGLFGNLADGEGILIDPTFDLYNQAFALFAYAQISVSMPERSAEMHDKALAILNVLKKDYKHPDAGFEEANPPRQPLCSNPHMHLFEAMQAWEAIDPKGPWSGLTDEIATLATTKFIDQKTGALREFFDHNWRPMPGDMGRVVEPGHQFEWAWLLARYAFSRKNTEALSKAKRLFEIGELHGICSDRGVAIMSLNDDFSVRDNIARLWPQTEWLKASLQLASMSSGKNQEFYLISACKALDALWKFLATPIQGLWYDKWPKDGSMTDEPAPASTFYHIVCAILELNAHVKLVTQKDL